VQWDPSRDTLTHASFKEIGLNEMAVCIFVGSRIASKTLIFSLPRYVAGQIIGCAPVTQV